MGGFDIYNEPSSVMEEMRRVEELERARLFGGHGALGQRQVSKSKLDKRRQAAKSARKARKRNR